MRRDNARLIGLMTGKVGFNARMMPENSYFIGIDTIRTKNPRLFKASFEA